MDGHTDTYDAVRRRASNDGRRDLFGSTHPQIAFVCECARTSCFETVLLTAAQHDALRPRPILAVGHVAAAA